MNFLVQKKIRIFDFLENIKSENLGFYFSFFLHFLILIITLGVPSFFDPKPINIPTIIPIEILNVSEVTSIPKEISELKKTKIKEFKVKEKKFNSSENQDIKKIKINDEFNIDTKEDQKEINSKENFIINEKKQIPLELKKEKIKINVKNSKSINTKKIKPRIKPELSKNINVEKIKSDINREPKPKPKPEQDFNIASMLKDLRNEKSIKKIDNDFETKDQKDQLDQNTKESQSDKEIAQLSISEIDLLRQQLSSCWNAPAGAVIEKGMLVKISAKLKQNRRLIDNSVRIVDTNISKSNSFYGPITESAMRTLLNPECIPLKLPEDKYDLWKNLIITFDYSIMKGY